MNGNVASPCLHYFKVAMVVSMVVAVAVVIEKSFTSLSKKCKRFASAFVVGVKVAFDKI